MQLARIVLVTLLLAGIVRAEGLRNIVGIYTNGQTLATGRVAVGTNDSTFYVGNATSNAVKVGDAAWSNNVTASITNGLATTNFVNTAVAGRVATNSIHDLLSVGNAGLLTNVPHIIAEASYGTNDLANSVAVSTSWGEVTNNWELTSGSMAGWNVVSNGIQYVGSNPAMVHSATTLSYKGDNASSRDYYFAMGVNGSVLERGRIVDSATSLNTESTAIHTFITVNSNDVVRLYVRSPSASGVTVITMNFVAMSLK